MKAISHLFIYSEQQEKINYILQRMIQLFKG